MIDHESVAEEVTERPIQSVSALTEAIKDSLQGGFPDVWVSGELTGFARPQSGHCYFTLKDQHAQLRGVMWRGSAARVRFDLHDGLEVVCHGAIDVYPPRGSYQLIVDAIEPRGVGALELALRQLQAKLAAEGLFDPARKRPLPRFPRRLAVVTSPTGAAIRDFLEVLSRRWRGTDVLILPVRVQGTGAAAEIAAAIDTAGSLHPAVDCIVVTRGGGSLEDLWQFNEEVTVRAIHRSCVPVVSAVGHEIDVTLCDLVADRRALTPSEAAEILVPSTDEVVAALSGYHRRMTTAAQRCVEGAGGRLAALAQRRVLKRPLDRIHDLTRGLDELAARSQRGLRRSGQQAAGRVEQLAGRLEALSPLKVLGRGYSLTHREADPSPVLDAAQLAEGQRLVTRFSKGTALSRIERIE